MGAGPKFVLVAGEASGDQLGGALVTELKSLYPDAQFAGIGGEKMRQAGLDVWWDVAELSVMGLFEVLGHLPRLLKLRRALTARILAERPDVLVGIDAPDFNLGLERQVRARGIPTVHYVSPTVWAWRRGRVKKIGKSADLVLCLFPFEPDCYVDQAVEARYTGHPLADAIPVESDRRAARHRFGLSAGARVIALLPGSRGSEADRLAGPLLDAAGILDTRLDHPVFLAPMATPQVRRIFESALAGRESLDCRVLDGQALDSMAAADVVICASGTATLECLLVNRPMVVVYRLTETTYFVGRALKLVKSRYFSLPNLLADETLVPELLQHDVTGANIAAEVEAWLDEGERMRRTHTRFRQLHEQLRRGAAARAAAEIQALLERRTHAG